MHNQPVTEDDVQLCMEALEGCPVERNIGSAACQAVKEASPITPSGATAWVARCFHDTPNGLERRTKSVRPDQTVQVYHVDSGACQRK